MESQRCQSRTFDDGVNFPGSCCTLCISVFDILYRGSSDGPIKDSSRKTRTRNHERTSLRTVSSLTLYRLLSSICPRPGGQILPHHVAWNYLHSLPQWSRRSCQG